MATLDQAIEAFGKRHGWPLEKARHEAENRIRVAVQDTLFRGDRGAIDRLPAELREHARDRYEGRVQAGEGTPGVVRISGLTGGPSVRRRSGAESARDEVAKVEASLTAERDAHHETEVSLEQVIARREELAEDVVAYDANEQAISALRTELGRRVRVIGNRERELDEARTRLRHAEWDDARRELEPAYAARRKRSDAVAGTIDTLSSQLEELTRSRAVVDELEAKFRALVPDDVDEWDFPTGRDEPEWPEVAEIVEAVAGGPCRPLAKTATAIAKARAEREKGEASRIAPAVTEALELGLFDRIRALPPRQLPDALAFAETRRDREVARLRRA